MNVLLTGACGGLGRELALQFAAHGLNLLLLDRKSRDLDRLSDEISDAGWERPGVCAMDLASADESAYQQLSAIVSEHYASIDLFVHCAARFEGLTPVDHLPLSEWKEALAVNLVSAAHITALLMPGLRASAQGRVVLPMESEEVSGNAYWGSYGVSKGALHLFANMLESELEGSGVEIIRFYPGAMRTGLRAKAYLSEDPESVRHPRDAAGQLLALLGLGQV